MKLKKALGWLSEKIIKYRVAVVVCVLIACIFAAYGVTLTSVNSDVLSYLPKGTDTYNGGQFLYEHFSLNSNAVLAIDGGQISYAELEDVTAQISDINGVSAVLWSGSFDSITLDTLYGKLSIDSNVFDMIDGGEKSRAKLEELFNRGGNYLVMVSMTVGASTEEAGVILDKIDDLLQSTEYVSGGTAPISRQVYEDAIAELPIYIVLAAVLVLILLFLVNTSYLEPIIFMVTMGVAILINMGTNFLFGEISIITFCASSVLQLAMAMDYAIFLTHMYKEERAKSLLPNVAIRSALSKTFGTVFSSALTTMGGFAAFFVMSFTLGADLGGVLIKGIALSLITVIIVQPCLLLIFNKPMEKSQHRTVHLEFKRLTRFSIKYRTVIVIGFAVLLIPAFIGQNYLSLTYLNFLPEGEGSAELTSYVSDTGNQIFLALPVSSDNQREHLDFVAQVEALDVVNSVTGYYAFLPEEAFNESGKLVLHIGEYAMAVDAASAGGSIGLVSDGYTLYMVALSSDLGIETQEAVDALNSVLAITDSHFDGYYVTGMTQAVKDFKVLTPRDFLWITLLSILIIFAVLLFTFKNVKYPLLLVLMIEMGIWINLSISTVFGQSLNFMSYIIIGAIQLGATVDYAILVSTKYLRKLKEGKDSLSAAYESSVSSSMSVLTSASIMVVACISVALITSNAVIKEITFLVTRGAVISAVLVLFVLPALLACSSRLDVIAKEAGGMRALTSRFLSGISGQFKKVAEHTTLKGADSISEDLQEGIKQNGGILSKANGAPEEKDVELPQDNIGGKDDLIGGGERLESLQCGNLAIIQGIKGYRFTEDSVVITNLLRTKESDTVVDLGCGCGVIGILAAGKKGVKVIGVELQSVLASRARRSAQISGLADRVSVVNADIKDCVNILGESICEVVVSNPPYYKISQGGISPNEEIAIAKHEVKITLQEVVTVGAKLLKAGGLLYVVIPTERQKELEDIAAQCGIGLKEIIYLVAKSGKPPQRMIAIMYKGNVSEVKTDSLVMRNENGEMTAEMAKLYNGD